MLADEYVQHKRATDEAQRDFEALFGRAPVAVNVQSEGQLRQRYSKGFRLMQCQGFVVGERLGKTQQGLLEPLISSKMGQIGFHYRLGLGATPPERGEEQELHKRYELELADAA